MAFANCDISDRHSDINYLVQSSNMIIYTCNLRTCDFYITRLYNYYFAAAGSVKQNYQKFDRVYVIKNLFQYLHETIHDIEISNH